VGRREAQRGKEEVEEKDRQGEDEWLRIDRASVVPERRMDCDGSVVGCWQMECDRVSLLAAGGWTISTQVSWRMEGSAAGDEAGRWSWIVGSQFEFESTLVTYAQTGSIIHG
jgi:hypothetical protein